MTSDFSFALDAGDPDRSMYPPAAELIMWVRAHRWAVTTEADCNGWPEDLRGVPRYALYDANEDDPPIAVFDFREDAERVATALTEFGALFGPAPAASAPKEATDG